jgi:hypothetical protein
MPLATLSPSPVDGGIVAVWGCSPLETRNAPFINEMNGAFVAIGVTGALLAPPRPDLSTQFSAAEAPGVDVQVGRPRLHARDQRVPREGGHHRERRP